jgi:hypothetical protein
MGRTSSTTHPGLYHVKAPSATLLTTNYFLLIEVEFMGIIGKIEKMRIMGKIGL